MTQGTAKSVTATNTTTNLFLTHSYEYILYHYIVLIYVLSLFYCTLCFCEALWDIKFIIAIINITKLQRSVNTPMYKLQAVPFLFF